MLIFSAARLFRYHRRCAYFDLTTGRGLVPRSRRGNSAAAFYENRLFSQFNNEARTMISETQKQLCMRFANGALSQAEPPEWFLAHLKAAELEADWQGSPVKVGLKSWETFDGSETHEIL
jgi:hypothetical protein